MIEKGGQILIEEIGNGIMIKPYSNVPGGVYCSTDILAFNKQESFIRWIKLHFNFVEKEEKEPYGMCDGPE